MFRSQSYNMSQTSSSKPLSAPWEFRDKQYGLSNPKTGRVSQRAPSDELKSLCESGAGTGHDRRSGPFGSASTNRPVTPTNPPKWRPHSSVPLRGYSKAFRRQRTAKALVGTHGKSSSSGQSIRKRGLEKSPSSSPAVPQKARSVSDSAEQ